MRCGTHRGVNPALRRSWSADLDTATLYALIALRSEIFVVEQNCAYQDLDGADLQHNTRHFWLEHDNAIQGTVRLVETDGANGPEFHIGRLCVLSGARGQGHARRLVQAALAEVGSAPCRLNAQTPLTDWYTRHGFVPDGAEFVEDGIAHTPMLRAGRLAGRARISTTIEV